MPFPVLATDSAFAWRRLLFSVLLGVASNASMWTSVSLMPALQDHFALSRSQASWPYIAIIAGLVLATPVLGRLSDRFGIAPVMMCAFALAGLSYLTSALADHLPLFLITQLGIGLGTAVGFGPLVADVSHWFQRRRGLAIAIVSGSAYLSGMLWLSVSARILPLWGWQGVHAAVGLTLLACIPGALLLRRSVPDRLLQEADRQRSLAMPATGLSLARLTLILAIAGTGCCIAMAMPQVHLVALCMDLGFSFAQGGQLLSVMLAMGILSRLICGILIDHVGPIPMLLTASALQTLSLLLYIFMQGFAPLVMVSALFGLAQGGILPAYPMIVRQLIPARMAGTAIGTAGAATQFGMAFGGWLSGAIHDASGSYLYAFLNGILWNGVNVALILYLFWTIRAGRGVVAP